LNYQVRNDQRGNRVPSNFRERSARQKWQRRGEYGARSTTGVRENRPKGAGKTRRVGQRPSQK
jgi:hypothetical protein